MDRWTFVMPWGKYKGRTLKEIADEDILYLDWLNGKDLPEPFLGYVRAICKEREDEIECKLL